MFTARVRYELDDAVVDIVASVDAAWRRELRVVVIESVFAVNNVGCRRQLAATAAVVSTAKRKLVYVDDYANRCVSRFSNSRQTNSLKPLIRQIEYMQFRLCGDCALGSSIRRCAFRPFFLLSLTEKVLPLLPLRLCRLPTIHGRC